MTINIKFESNQIFEMLVRHYAGEKRKDIAKHFHINRRYLDRVLNGEIRTDIWITFNNLSHEQKLDLLKNKD